MLTDSSEKRRFMKKSFKSVLALSLAATMTLSCADVNSYAANGASVEYTASEISGENEAVTNEESSELSGGNESSTRTTYSGTSREQSGTTGKVYEPEHVAQTSVYKDMDYTFLRDFDYASTYSDVTATYNTVAEMASSDMVRLKEGVIIKTRGYYKKGDGGACAYKLVKNKGTGSVEMDNGLYALPMPDKYTDKDGKVWYVANVRQYGAKGDGKEAEHANITQCYSRINEVTAEDETVERGIAYIPEGEYKCSDCVSISCKNVNIVGEGSKTILFTDNDYRKDTTYQEHFFQSWGSENVYFGDFTLEAREVDVYKYMRQFSLMYSKQIYIYNVDMLIPQSCYNNYYYEDKQYSNFCCYTGNRDITVDGCKMVQMTSTFRGANIGVLDIWSGGEENITIMNCDLYGDARDEQIGFFSKADENAFVHNVEFINNTIHSYEPRYSNVVGNATMRFTVAYSDSHDVTGIHIAGNHFITECDSKFMTFGAVKNCVVEDNIIEVLCSYATWSMVFDSSNSDPANIMVKNNDFFISTRTHYGKGNIIGGKLTFNNNRLLCAVGLPFGICGNIVNGNEIIMLTRGGRMTSNSDEFNDNLVRLFAGSNHQGAYSLCFAAYGGDADCVKNMTNNVIYNYVRENPTRPVFQSAISLDGDIGTLNIVGNKYYEPNTRYSGSQFSADVSLTDDIGKHYLGHFFRTRSGTYKNINVKDNIIQNMYEEESGRGIVYTNNTYLPPTGDLTEELTSHTDISYKGEVVKEITTTEESIDLDDIEYIATEKDEEGNVVSEKQVYDKDVMWFTSVEELATVDKDGVVTRKGYGDVTVYAVPLDGSECKHGQCVIHFEKAKATSIDVKEEDITLQPGLKRYVEYTVLPEDDANQSITFESTNPEVATVSSIGKIQAVANGKCKIICKTTDGSGVTKEINVTVEDISVKRITPNPVYHYFTRAEIGQTKQISIGSYYPDDATNKKISKWESTDESIAVITESNDQTATVKAVGPGRAFIRAYSEDGKCYGTCGIYVELEEVKNLKAIGITNEKMKLTWTMEPKANGYFVYQWNDETSEWEQKADINRRENTWYDATKLTPGKEYRFLVKAYMDNWMPGYKISHGNTGTEIKASTFSFMPVSGIWSSSEYLSLSDGHKAVFTASNGAEVSNVTMTVNVKNASEVTNKEIDFQYDNSIIDIVRTNYDEKTAKYHLYINAVKEGDTEIVMTAKDGSGVQKVVPVRVRKSRRPSEVTASTDLCGKIKIDFKAVVSEDEQGNAYYDESNIDGYIVERYVGYHFEDIVYIPKENKESYSYTYNNIPDESEYKYAVYAYTYDGKYYYQMGHTDATGKTLVSTKMESLTPRQNEYTVYAGKSIEVPVDIGPDNVTDTVLDWESGDTEIFKVKRNDNGSDSNKVESAVVTGVSKGQAVLNIYSTDGTGLKASVKINVIEDEKETTKPSETTSKEEGTTKPAETTKKEETTKPTETTKKEEETTKPSETTSKEEGTTKPSETTKKEEGTTKPAETTKKEEETTKQEETTKKPSTTPGITDKQADSAARKTNTDKSEIKGASFAPLKLRATAGKKSIKLKWSKMSKADGYIIYGGRCGAKLKKIKTVSKKTTSYTVKKLAAGKYYKYSVMAYKKDGKVKRIISISTCAHCCVLGGKHGNPISISNVKSSVTLRKNKKYTVKPKMKSGKNTSIHLGKFRYESTNKKIATVSKKGVIKGIKKGSCYVYVYTQNGLYKRIKVRVK